MGWMSAQGWKSGCFPDFPNSNVTQEPFLSTLICFYGIIRVEGALRMDSLGTPWTSMPFNALLSAYNYYGLFDEISKQQDVYRGYLH